jgi:predicted transcriptional regulator
VDFCWIKKDSLSIVADILESARLGAKKTRIIFVANLSFKLLEKYLDGLAGWLIRAISNKYRLTDEGQRFLGNHPFLETDTLLWKVCW